ncbi:MAG: hypothetical protein U5K43_06670 [Halofilum sp. (in: g-proteobacteria)]|nr:hypothetical protein [Halofilum sp. (in: g-proteobacteria)]
MSSSSTSRPTGSIPTQIHEMRALIRSLAEDACVLVSTHILQEVQAVCDRVLMLREGRMALDARLDQLGGATRLLLTLDTPPERAQSLFADVRAGVSARRGARAGQRPTAALRRARRRRRRRARARRRAPRLRVGLCALHPRARDTGSRVGIRRSQRHRLRRPAMRTAAARLRAARSDRILRRPSALLFIGAFLAVTLFVFFWAEAFFARGIADVRPLFEWMPILLIALVAALTMRSWSEERRAGTLEVLLSAPVSAGRPGGGKFLAALSLVALSLALTLPLPLTVEYLGRWTGAR